MAGSQTDDEIDEIRNAMQQLLDEHDCNLKKWQQRALAATASSTNEEEIELKSPDANRCIST